MLARPNTRAVCFLIAGLLYGAGLMDVAIVLGARLKVNVALMLLAVGSAFLVLGIVATTSPRRGDAERGRE